MDNINNLISNNIDLSGLEKFAVIIGYNPSKTARSPILWNAAFKANNLNYAMLPLDVEAKNLIKVLENLKDNPNFIGGSITIPYKSEVAKILKQNLTDEAKAIGAINCIYKDEKNQLVGTNTDGEASLVAFKNKFGDIKNKKILILGTGGAGKAVITYFSHEKKTDKLYISSRKKNIEIVDNLKNVVHIDWDKRVDFLNEVDVLINCTSLGFDNYLELSPLNKENLSLLKKSCIVYDIIYNPLKTNLLKYSESLGLKIINGLEMNLLQASIAFNYAVKLNNDIAEKAMRKV